MRKKAYRLLSLLLALTLLVSSLPRQASAEELPDSFGWYG